ncbi:gamma-glutamyltransferase [Kineococcus sp. SYSU DK018]|uniref:gamma-glutamyltransferase n=1 Tax=Kineococcus sp. SYSU DK018 TaxID=3383139 RepID=UPI003D7DFF8F
MPQRRRTSLLALAGLTAGVAVAGPAGPVSAAPTAEKVPLAVGTGGAVATVDPDATRIGLDVLADGGNAADAAVAAAAALGVTEPYSAGVGGGGFFVYYDAGSGEVSTIDGRETAPMAMGATAFLGEDGEPLPFADAVNSGLSVGTPGTPRTWERALEEFGTKSLRDVLSGPTALARDGFVVDETFRQQTADNEERFRLFPATAELFLPGGQLPEVGSVFRNPDLARTYRQLAARGVDSFYDGRLADEIAATAQDPQEAEGVPEAYDGLLTSADLAAYDAPLREATKVEYRGLEVYGMAPPSSGGTTVGEALNILDEHNLASIPAADRLHHYLEAGALAFADRNAYVGDPAYTQVPVDELLSEGFAAERSCEIDPTAAAVKPVPAGVPDGEYAPCGTADGASVQDTAAGVSTTHLTVADAEGNIASYTLTIEQTGGSGITVPGRGFLLNNELTDFTFAPADLTQPEPNLPAPGKRPRSSMAPTIVLDDGEPLMALGSPGGSTIITTVLQTLVNRVDANMRLDEAIAAPRATPRNTASVNAEPAFLQAHGAELTALGHAFSETAEIGAATAVEFLPTPEGRTPLLLAAAETTRRGGGSAGVVDDVYATTTTKAATDLAPRLVD